MAYEILIISNFQLSTCDRQVLQKRMVAANLYLLIKKIKKKICQKCIFIKE